MSSVDPAAIYEVEPIPLDLPSVLPPRSAGRDRARFAASLIFGLLLHASILWLLERDPRADIPPVEEAIPVEVIIEPPPPEPEPAKEPEPEPEPQKPQQEFFEKPATDAPRSSESGGTGQQTEPKPPEQKPEQKPAQEPSKAADPWGLQGQLPEMRFDAPAPKTKLLKGNAERTYLTTIYAHIMQYVDLPEQKIKTSGELVIRFGIDSAGHVFQSALIQSSGNRELDSLALAAVRRASPLPAPPAGGPIYPIFTLDVR